MSNLRPAIMRAAADHLPLADHGCLSEWNLVIAFWNELAPRLKPARLHCVRLFETPRNFAEYHGPLVA